MVWKIVHNTTAGQYILIVLTCNTYMWYRLVYVIAWGKHMILLPYQNSVQYVLHSPIRIKQFVELLSILIIVEGSYSLKIKIIRLWAKQMLHEFKFQKLKFKRTFFFYDNVSLTGLLLSMDNFNTKLKEICFEFLLCIFFLQKEALTL